ncbi:uncharacterized protein C7orf57 homolog isoform X5 [Narcine bancroftii]|uniref:uncharacterized protein C7orf57 homolog isoform X5 n=1 Tax=Narcine bancroftii TaxID=1343680 RepID=UPI0038317CE2
MDQLKSMSHVKEDNSNNKQRETSLMPGLGYMSTGEERFRGRRSIVFDSDSDYVKLAKRGGLSDLLTFGDVSTEPTCASFSRPDWLTSESSFQGNRQIIQKRLSDSSSQDTSQDESEGRNYNSSPTEAADQQLCEKEENRESQNIKSGTPEIDIRRQRDRNKPSLLQMETMTLSTETNQQMTQPPIPVNQMNNRFTRRKEPPVDMQKLLRFGYADDWFSECQDAKNTKEQNMEHLVAVKEDVLLEGNHPTYQGKRMTGIRACGKNKAIPESESFFKIFGEHRLKDIPRSVEKRVQSEIALA